MSFMIMDLDRTRRNGSIPGACAHCGGEVWEGLVTLDDAYAVWAGRCPHCKGVNLLAINKGRGYSSSKMWLVKPTPEEMAEYPMLAPVSS